MDSNQLAIVKEGSQKHKTPVINNDKVNLIPEKADAPPSNAGYSLPGDALESEEGEIQLVPLGISKEQFPRFFIDYSSKLSI